MEFIEDTLLASRARVDESHARILRSAVSEYETQRIVESTLARVKHCRDLLANGKKMFETSLFGHAFGEGLDEQAGLI